MTVSGIPAASLGVAAARPEQHRDASAARGQVPAPTQAPAGPAPSAARPVRPTDQTIPVAAPPGTDPELWSILTTAERDFFARSATQGPLTYSKVMSPHSASNTSAPTARGGRVDVRV